MFSTIVIHAGSTRPHRLRYLIAAAPILETVRDLNNSPTEHELKLICGRVAPDVLIIDIELPESVVFASIVREVLPQAAIIGFGGGIETSLIAPKLGFDALVSGDADGEALTDAVEGAIRKRKGGIEKSLFCFLPAKAGSGCSTIVMNTAAALARDHKKSVLVLDTDLRSGILGTLLAVEPRTSIQNLLSSIDQVDRKGLRNFVVHSQGVDYLVSSRSLDTNPPEWTDYFHLLSIVIPEYDAILVDMPELINPATVEFVRRASETFVVSTPEIPAMTLASQRFTELARLNIPKKRLGLLINRWHKRDGSTDQIGDMIKHPVKRIFPNDYPAVRASIIAGRSISDRSQLGIAYSEFAGELIGKTPFKDSSFSGKLKKLYGLLEPSKA